MEWTFPSPWISNQLVVFAGRFADLVGFKSYSCASRVTAGLCKMELEEKGSLKAPLGICATNCWQIIAGTTQTREGETSKNKREWLVTNDAMCIPSRRRVAKNIGQALGLQARRAK